VVALVTTDRKRLDAELAHVGKRHRLDWFIEELRRYCRMISEKSIEK
jgi:hypothetical protein